MGLKYVIKDGSYPHFITFTVVQWVDALTRSEYKDIILDSLLFCIKFKGLRLHAYVIMSNHVHLIASAKDGFALSNILRDLKKYTSKKIVDAINTNSKESRKKWMVWIFNSAGERNSNNTNFQFWKQDNHPQVLDTNYLKDQKLEYLHNNPVVAGIVNNKECYKYSSALNYSGQIGLINVELLDG